MKKSARPFDELRIAVMVLTRLPAGQISDPAPDMAASRWAFPVIGAGVGVLCWVGYACALAVGLTPLLSALVALGVGVLVTGGLHEDGLADLADGLGGGSDKARKLEIMRDSRIGSFGVLALILVVLLKADSIAALGTIPVFWAFIAIAAASRFAIFCALVLMAPARDDGLGYTAADQGRQGFLPAAVLTLLAVFPITMYLGVPFVLLGLGLALGAAIPAYFAQKHIGGQTGDVLGAIQQCSETGGWLALVVATSTM